MWNKTGNPEYRLLHDINSTGFEELLKDAATSTAASTSPYSQYHMTMGGAQVTWGSDQGHGQGHYSLADPSRTCPICGVVCDRPSYLARHMTQHTGEKPFRCSVCGKGYTRKMTWKVHMMSHMEQDWKS